MIVQSSTNVFCHNRGIIKTLPVKNLDIKNLDYNILGILCAIEEAFASDNSGL
jgi:hypothetical protein